MTEHADDGPEFLRRLEELAERVDALEDAIVASTTPAKRTMTPLFATVDDWVTEYFALTYVRPLGGEFRWCAQWWAHPEAVVRLEALWRTWEQLRHDPVSGMATWLREHLDHQLPLLLAPRGPFARCAVDRHDPGPPLPVRAHGWIPNLSTGPDHPQLSTGQHPPTR